MSPVVYGAALEDDWTSEDTWYKANPSLGIAVPVEKVRDACNNALQNPAEENAFRQLRLNQWVKQSVRWIPMHVWEKNSDPVDLSELEGRVCYGGLDNLGSALENNNNLGESLSEVIWLIALLGNQSVLIHNLTHPDDRKREITVDEVELLTTPGDLASYREAITAALVKGTRRDIVSAPKEPQPPTVEVKA